MTERETLKPLISPENHHNKPITRHVIAGVNDLVEKILAIDKVRSIYDSLPECRDPFEFLECTLKRLHIDHRVDAEGLRAIPPTGSVIVISNHPFGGIDGMVLASALSAVRKDIKILVNYFLQRISELSPLFFAVDPFQGATPSNGNITAIRQAIRWINNGGMLVVLPAGEVSHFSWKQRKIEDPEWSPTVGRLVHLTKAPVLPVYFTGRNSTLFQVAGFAHPRLRTALLPRETLKKEGADVRLKIGSLLPYRNLSLLKNPSKLTEYLRFRTDLLGMSETKHQIKTWPKALQTRQKVIHPIARTVDPELLSRDVNALHPNQRLLSTSQFSVHYALSGQIPMILREIGRLRERTFRPLGEGTGNAIDLDRFDNIYTHLFVWNKNDKELVGAYRLGPTMDILPRHGRKGLYTYSLFRYRKQLLNKIGPALELGRTFIRPKYQKEYSPLLLLWRGIGRYIALNPVYRTLFGAVSISSDYGCYSRQLMAAFLHLNNYSRDLSKMVRPRQPFRHKKALSLIKGRADFHRNDPDELSSWISGIEKDGKGVPILLRQYLKLGGKVLAFNVDPAFGDALDGLMVVDLTLTPRKVLRRYMGTEGFERFIDFHAKTAIPEQQTVKRPFLSEHR